MYFHLAAESLRESSPHLAGPRDRQDRADIIIIIIRGDKSLMEQRQELVGRGPPAAKNQATCVSSLMGSREITKGRGRCLNIFFFPCGGGGRDSQVDEMSNVINKTKWTVKDCNMSGRGETRTSLFPWRSDKQLVIVGYYCKTMRGGLFH